ncbi:VapE domain-containing protein [Spirosoma sp.]|uniref:VapE domain-containing protein n=1 Tax=Spirosoma sp. TaxID=1899569 RepID=UPI00260734D7|nr:VapE domain-containing protein [Spirosoma sp.]MCX6214651.1 PriCT-2 domain-containing protein [Spirosoma sp.]
MNLTTDKKLISVFKNKFDNGLTKDGQPDPKRLSDIDIKEFLEGVRNGVWRKEVEWVREAADKAIYDKRKSTVPGVTIWGTFIIRNAGRSDVPSGLMSVDLDHLDESEIQRVFNLLKADPYVYAVFRSIGGKGLCVIFRVDYQRWLESFEGIRIYLTEQHGLVMGWDASVKDICRLRFVSYDPDTYVNYKAQLFKRYPRKEKKEAPKLAYTHTETDIRYVLDQIHARALDLTGSYEDWFRIGWALISQYGDAARGIFHEVSQYHPGYDSNDCDKKFNYLVATRPHSIKIATFYYYCRQAGLDTCTPQTKEVQSLAAMSKKQKVSLTSALDTVLKMTDIPEDVAKPVLEQVYASTEDFATQETLFDQLELFLKQNYPMRYNEVRRDFEDSNGTPIEDHHYYAIYMHARKVLGDKVRYEDIYKIIHSRTICEIFHPFLTFFREHKNRKPVGVIRALADTIESDTGFGDGEFEPNYVYIFLRKWLVGLIGAIYGTPCDLVPVLTGSDGIGKTWFFRLILPDEWRSYFLDSKWLPGKDEDVDMCKNIIAFNDEFKGRDTKDMEHFKALTSKEYFSVREVYTRKSVKLRRLAVLCATSNHKGVINEPEYNRRIVPINALSINHAAYNAIDKTDLIMEAYHAYQKGERYVLSKEERALLGSQTEEFYNKSIERQLIEQHLQLPTGKGGEQVQFMSTIDILARLELKLNSRKLDDRKVGRELQACGFIRKQKRTTHGKREWGYDVIALD